MSIELWSSFIGGGQPSEGEKIKEEAEGKKGKDEKKIDRMGDFTSVTSLSTHALKL